MKTNIKIIINLEPITKKNSQRIFINRRTRKPFIMPSAKYKEYESAAAAHIKYNGDPINEPVNIKCLFYMKTKRRVDLVNLLEAADDMLVKHRVIEDDNNTIIKGHDGSRVLYDKEKPRTEIYITTFGDGTPQQ